MEKRKDLTLKQAEIRALYYEDGLTQENIAHRLKISKMAVCKHLKAIRKKQGLPKLKKTTRKNRFTKSESGAYNPPKSKPIENKSFVRLHGLHFVVVPYYISDFYRLLIRTKQNVIPFFHGWRIELNRENIEMISLEDSFWIGSRRFEAFASAFKDFNKCLIRLENRLKVGIIKQDYMNIRLCKQHIAVVKDGVSQSIDDEKGYVTLFNEEGEAWFTWDWSKDEPEWETIHPQDAKIDHDTCQKYFGDWKQNNPPTNSELFKLMSMMAVGFEKMTTMMTAPYLQNNENMEALRQTNIRFKTDYIG